VGKYLIRRLLIAIPSLIGISVILFAVLALAPGDPFEELASNPNVPAEVATNLRKQFDLDDPVMVRYVRKARRGTTVHMWSAPVGSRLHLTVSWHGRSLRNQGSPSWGRHGSRPLLSLVMATRLTRDKSPFLT
jgi:hypothetical protein